MKKNWLSGLLLAVAMALTGVTFASPFDADPVFNADFNDSTDTLAFDVGKPDNSGAVAAGNDGISGDAWRCCRAAKASDWYWMYADRYVRRAVIVRYDEPVAAPAKVPI